MWKVIRMIIRQIISSAIFACTISFLFVLQDAANGHLQNITYDNLKTFVLTLGISFFVMQGIFEIINYIELHYASSKTSIIPKMPAATMITEKRNAEPSERVKHNATHEAGHAIIANHFNMTMSYATVSESKSYVTISSKFDTVEDVKQYITMIYGGAAAEELIYDQHGTGVFITEDSDFERATKFLKMAVVMNDKSVSKTMLDSEIATQVTSLSKELYQDALKIVTENRRILEVFAKELYIKGSMSEDELSNFFALYEKHKPAYTTNTN